MDLDLRKVLDFALKKPAIVDRAYFEFFGPLPLSDLEKEWEDLFLEWLIFDYQQKDGTSFFIEYTLKNPDKLGQDKIAQFKQVAETQFYSFFEIQDIKKGQWFILENLHDGKIYKVYEKRGTSIIKGSANLPGRIAKVNNRWYLIGANSVYFPTTYTKRAKKVLREMKIKNYSPKDTVEVLRNRGQSLPPKLTKKQIKNKKKELQKEYEKCLKKYQLSLSFSDLIQAVYREDTNNLIGFWESLLEKGLTEEFLMKETRLLQDIWNYFPQRCLNDMSPVEVYNQATEKGKK